mmetsp:Transcript_14252/g.45800  ORF Transcript_14252/g.45800 Transcript_14252/m.45800 type:complete len:220 (+) Transcript_14252:474-1133(+)
MRTSRPFRAAFAVARVRERFSRSVAVTTAPPPSEAAAAKATAPVPHPKSRTESRGAALPPPPTSPPALLPPTPLPPPPPSPSLSPSPPPPPTWQLSAPWPPRHSSPSVHRPSREETLFTARHVTSHILQAFTEMIRWPGFWGALSDSGLSRLVQYVSAEYRLSATSRGWDGATGYLAALPPPPRVRAGSPRATGRSRRRRGARSHPARGVAGVGPVASH